MRSILPLFAIAIGMFIANPVISQTFSASPTLPITAAQPTTHDIEVNTPGTIGKLTVYLHITHSYIGDLDVQLTHVETGTSILLLQSPSAGSCFEDNINVTLDDNAATDANSQCSATPPAIRGIARPVEALSAFIGETIQGSWRISITDSDPADDGVLQTWSLSFTDSESPSNFYINAFSDSTRLHWDNSTLTGLDAYNIYRASESDPEALYDVVYTADAGPDTTYIDYNVENGKAYTYRITAADTSAGSSQESAFSNLDQAIPNSTFANSAFFDGTDDNVQVSNDVALMKDQGTIEFWLKIDESPAGKNNGYYMIANKLNSSGENGWSFYHDEYKLVAQMKNDLGGIVNVVSGVNLIDSTWHHIAMAYDFTGTEQTILYIDGTQVSWGMVSLELTTNPIVIGEGTGSFWTDFEGYIDEFRMWDYMKTEEQIAATMRNRTNGTEEGLVMVLNLDEPNGSTTVYDGSPNNLNGTVNGDVQFITTAEPIIPEITYSTPPDFERSMPLLEDEFSLAPSIVTVADITFSTSGDKMYVVGQSWDRTFQYNLTVPFDPSTASISATLDVSDHGAVTHGIAFNDTGDQLFVILANNTIYQYNLSIPFAIGTASYSNINYNLADISLARDIAFGDNGRKLFVLNKTDIFQFSLTAPYDLSTITDNMLSVDAPNFEDDAKSLVFSKDGTRLFVTGKSTDLISQMNLPNAFDLKDASSSGSYYLEEEGAPSGLALSADGEKLFMTGTVNNSVFSYRLETATFKEEFSDTGEVIGSGVIAIKGETFTNQGGQLTHGADYTITNLPEGFTPELSVNETGHLATLVLNGSADTHDIQNSLSDLIFSFENTAFESGSVTGIRNATQASSQFEISFIGSLDLTIISDDSVAIDENITGEIMDVEAFEGAMDLDEGITYSLISDQDADLFYINEDTGVIFFNVSPDFESPEDSDGDNLYELTVVATSNTDETTQSMKIVVLDLNDNAPVIAPDQVFTVSEDAPAGGTTVGSVVVTDSDTETTFSNWSIVDADAQLPFDIDQEGQIMLVDVLNFESKSAYHFNIEVSDGENFSMEEVTVEVTNVNEAPFVTGPIDDLNFDEGFGGHTIPVAGIFSDPDGDALSVSAFSNNSDVVTASVTNGSILITENSIGSATITVTANDGAEEVQTAFSVTVNDNNVNDSPELIINTELTLSQGEQATITNDVLLATDTDNTASEIVYTLTTLPSNGTLLKNNSELAVNATFTQADIDSELISYKHGGANQASDSFSFDITDGQGGTLTNNTFQITIDIVLAIDKDLTDKLSVYPVPVVQEATIRIVNSYHGRVDIRLIDTTGKVVIRKSMTKKTNELIDTLQTSQLSPGIAYLQIVTSNSIETLKIIKK